MVPSRNNIGSATRMGVLQRGKVEGAAGRFSLVWHGFSHSPFVLCIALQVKGFGLPVLVHISAFDFCAASIFLH